MTARQVRVPSRAVGGDDISSPATALLRDLSLLPTSDEYARARGPASTFSGPPDSVALIEAGATAAAKWWAAGLSGAVIAIWTAIRFWWWHVASDSNKDVALWGGAIVTAAVVIAIAYLLGSDVRGRAAVAAETVRARANVAEAFVRMTEQAYAARVGEHDSRLADNSGLQIAALPSITVENVAKPRAEERGWHALAVLTDGERRTRYLVVKGESHEWVESCNIKLP